MIRAIPNRNGREFETFYIRPRSGVDSAQWNWCIIGSLELNRSEFTSSIGFLAIPHMGLRSASY